MALNLRKIICAAVAALCAAAIGAGAEMHDNAVGLRLAGGSLFGAEANYQKALGGNRLELGVSIGYNEKTVDNSDPVFLIKRAVTYLGAVGFYQWRWDIDNVNGLAWYAGPGAGIGFWSNAYKTTNASGTTSMNYAANHTENSGAYVDAGGQIGIEYDLNPGTPLLLSLDIRPMFGVLSNSDDGIGGFGWGIGLGIRYTL
ncbi:hypothetical protein R80B4_00512 [Fibrobacteres bacterium R8-0-B4]